MKAELKRLHSPDANDLSKFAPSDPRHFGLFVQVMAGPAGQTGEESFDLIVCTPAWLCEKLESSGPIIGLHHVIVAEFHYRELELFIRSYCERCVGLTWQEVALQVGRLGRWEFEDYQV